MTYTSLHAIVNNVLMRRKYPIHWYIDFLVYAKDCFRELTMDDLKCVQAKILPVNSDDNTVDIPSDYLDYIKVGLQVGQNVRPLVPTDSLNRVTNRNSSFQPIPYFVPNSNQNATGLYYGAINNVNWLTVSWNEYGEFIGRQYGAGAGVQDDVFQIMKEKNKIQLTDHLTGLENIVLEYVSNGMNADAATHVESYAQATIEAYILWQMKEHTRTYSEGEKERGKQDYIEQRKVLRARMSDLTIDGVRRSIQASTFLSIK